MTPPLSRIILAQVAAKLPPPTLDKGVKGQVPDKSPDVYVADAKAKGGDPVYSEIKDLLAAISDENLFGIYLSKYQAEKNKKYKNVALALAGVRGFLEGNVAYADFAKNKIVAWLSDPEVLKDPVAHQARVNLIKALKRAPDKPELKEGLANILKALTDNYSTAKTVPPAPPPTAPADAAKVSKSIPAAFKDVKELLEALSKEKLFGDKFEELKKEKTKKFQKVNITLEVIRGFVGGEKEYLDLAKTKIVAWLSDSKLLTDPVAHQARVNLIVALSRAPQGKKDWNEGIGLLLKALKDDYSKNSDEDKAAAPPAPPPLADEPKEDKSQTIKSAVFFFTDPGKKGDRKDSFNVLINKIKPILKNSQQALLVDHSDVSIVGEMRFIIDNKNGQVVKVSFKDMKVQGDVKEEEVTAMFEGIAHKMNAQISFEKTGTDPAQEVVWPIDMVPPAKPKPKEDL